MTADADGAPERNGSWVSSTTAGPLSCAPERPTHEREAGLVDEAREGRRDVPPEPRIERGEQVLRGRVPVGVTSGGRPASAVRQASGPTHRSNMARTVRPLE